MGLFKRRADPDEMQRLRAEIASMGLRLEAADQARRQPVDHVDPAEVRDLRTELESMRAQLHAAEAAALQPDPRVDPDEVQHLRAELESMRNHLRSTDEAEHQLRDRLDELAHRLDAPSPAPPEPPAPGIEPADFAQVRGELEMVVTRLEQIDQRMTAISSELANQITELSGDIDALGSNTPPTDDIVEQLRDAQTRLAMEQARYQIAFRRELADLVDRLRRS
jgi:DNA repair exonuclease SbcCD ATPase subunit